MSSPNGLLRRLEAVEQIQKRFEGKPFLWGQSDCITVARSLLVALGHKPPKLPGYRSAAGARRALDDRGFKSVQDLLDSLLPRINPAEAILGDLVALAGTEGFPAVTISAGSKLIGFHEEEEGLVPLVAHSYVAAWRTYEQGA